MTVYTIKVKARPRPTVTKIRRRLRGNALTHAKAARKYLQMAINFDNRLTGGTSDVSATRLIFAGDAVQMSLASTVVTTLTESIASTLKVIKN